MKHEKVYLLTDGCMWEANKCGGTSHPHAVEVVDLETGAIRYIRSGSKITFVQGTITDIRTQGAYNKATEKRVLTNRKTYAKRARSKRQSKTDRNESL